MSAEQEGHGIGVRQVDEVGWLWSWVLKDPEWKGQGTWLQQRLRSGK
jgi:hypothetical protein